MAALKFGGNYSHPVAKPKIVVFGVGGGGVGGGGGLLLHTLGCAYFKFFNNIVLPHKSHVPVGALFFINSSLFVLILI
jgi:hypothetical protein